MNERLGSVDNWHIDECSAMLYAVCDTKGQGSRAKGEAKNGESQRKGQTWFKNFWDVGEREQMPSVTSSWHCLQSQLALLAIRNDDMHAVLPVVVSNFYMISTVVSHGVSQRSCS